MGRRKTKLQAYGESYTMLSYMYCILRITIRSLKSRRLRWAGHVAHMEQTRSAYSVLLEKPEGKRPLGRPRRIWEDNIRMYFREVRCDPGQWIDIAEDRDQ